MESLQSLKESLDIIDDPELVSLYHAITHNYHHEILSATQIVGWIEAVITGHTTVYPVDCMMDLVDNYEWVDLDVNNQIKIVANNIKKLLLKK